MAEGRDARDPAGGTAAEAPLPSPERLSIYTFRSRYHALNLPLWIGLIAVVLVLLHILRMHLFHKYDHLPKSAPDRIRWYLVSVFDLGEEESFGTYFSAVLLLFIGRIAWGHAKQLFRAREVWAIWWILLAAVFHILSLEEVVNLHTTLKEWFRRQDVPIEGNSMRGVLLWISLFVSAAMVPFLWHVRGRFAAITAAAGALYLLGALGIDHWQGKVQHPEYEDRFMWVALEEALEMLAPVLFLHGLLAYLARDPRGIVEEKVEVLR